MLRFGAFYPQSVSLHACVQPSTTAEGDNINAGLFYFFFVADFVFVLGIIVV